MDGLFPKTQRNGGYPPLPSERTVSAGPWLGFLSPSLICVMAGRWRNSSLYPSWGCSRPSWFKFYVILVNFQDQTICFHSKVTFKAEITWFYDRCPKQPVKIFNFSGNWGHWQSAWWQFKEEDRTHWVKFNISALPSTWYFEAFFLVLLVKAYFSLCTKLFRLTDMTRFEYEVRIYCKSRTTFKSGHMGLK